jgi:indole-3-glycerol phosphate synthase
MITDHHDKHIDEITNQHHSLDDKQVKILHEFLEHHKQRLQQDQDNGKILAEFKKTSGIQSSNKDGHIQKIIEEYKVQLKA